MPLMFHKTKYTLDKAYQISLERDSWNIAILSYLQESEKVSNNTGYFLTS